MKKRKIKIIASIGPSTQDPEILRKMEKYVDIRRRNLSHCDDKKDFENRCKDIKGKISRPLIFDTRGPELRIQTINFAGDLETGTEIYISQKQIEEKCLVIDIDLDRLKSVKTIHINDRKILLDIIEHTEKGIRCRIKQGGNIRDHAKIGFEPKVTNLGILKSIDEEQCTQFIDSYKYLAVSFVNTAQEIIEVKNKIPNKKYISKIETKEGVKNLKKIIKESDQIMIARGDLGTEYSIQELPKIQSNIIKTCKKHKIRCIVATDLLPSMMNSPIPSKPEVDAIARLVKQGVDTFMLTGETIIGKYPLETVKYLHKIIEQYNS